MVAVNGLFGQRMTDVAARCGAEVVAVEHEWGRPVDVDRVLSAHPSPAIIAAVHAETSTGVRSDIAALGAGKGDALLLTDAVTSIGGIELRADDWGVDLGYAGTQKCLGVAPGSPRSPSTTVPSSDGWRRRARGTSTSGCSAATSGRPGCAGPAHLPPHRADRDGREPARRPRADPRRGPRRRVGAAPGGRRRLQAGLQAMGLELFAEEGSRLPELTTVKVPDGVDSAAVRARLLERHGIEIGAGAGAYASTVWRIG